MTAENDDLIAMLDIDAGRLAAAIAEKDALGAASLSVVGHPLQVRLMNGWPREAKPAFDKLNQILAPYGYALSPPHPTRPGRTPEAARALQTELHRPEKLSDDAPFAPLLLALDERAGSVRLFVQQFGGRSAPDFSERHVSVLDPVNVAWLESALHEYVTCMLRSRNAGT